MCESISVGIISRKRERNASLRAGKRTQPGAPPAAHPAAGASAAPETVCMDGPARSALAAPFLNVASPTGAPN